MTTLNPPCHTDHESGFSALALVENAIGVSLLSDANLALERAPLNDDELRRIHAYWRAANYLSVGQIYLLDNPLLREP